MVLRSHECVQEGYEVLHDGRLITIFSASRYCGTQTNKGAFITFGHDLQPEIQQFYAHAMESTSFESKADAEEDMLDEAFFVDDEKSRLGCQIKITNELEGLIVKLAPVG